MSVTKSEVLITITTKREEISIYFLSQKITIEKEWNRSSDENKETDNDEKGEN